ncbi:hypothetical protein TNIN_146501, partial [Trichonephila inaurata madagascariensis]
FVFIDAVNCLKSSMAIEN